MLPRATARACWRHIHNAGPKADPNGEFDWTTLCVGYLLGIGIDFDTARKWAYEFVDREGLNGAREESDAV